MGELKDIAEKNRQLKKIEEAQTRTDNIFQQAQESHVQTVARATREAEKKIKQNYAMSASTSTNSDNEMENEESESDKVLDRFQEADAVKKEKHRKDNKDIDGAADNSEEIKAREEKQRKAEADSKREAESKKAQKETSDRFNKRDQHIKEHAQNTEAHKLDKIGNEQEKLNMSHSLDKMRGMDPKKVGEVANQAAKALRNESSKESGKAVAAKIEKEAAKASAGATAKAAATTAAEAPPVALIIAAIVLVILLLFWIVIVVNFLVTIMSSGGRSSNSSTTSATYEEAIIYQTLLDHYDGNTTPVLGIMCNIQHESGFKANNLENTNNYNWGISDEEFTASVNSGEITKEDFCKSTYNGMTNGYYNGYGQWVNTNGGYGFCQYTAYNKKESLYNFATEWFSEGGTGEGNSFNIADPDMQANYIVYLLENDYSYIDERLKAITGDSQDDIIEAAYIWVSLYEIPNPRYTIKSDGSPCTTYREVAEVRAQNAQEILSACENMGAVSSDFSGEIDGTYFKHEGSGPCHACAIATVAKRYNYMKGDAFWNEITPDIVTDDNQTIHDAIVANEGGGDTRTWYVDDNTGNVHAESANGWSPSTGDINIQLNGYSYTFKTVNSGITEDELISLLSSHPEGVVVYSTYGNGGYHAKVITRYDGSTFYCIDSVNSSRGVGEVPLAETSCWWDFSRVVSYKYIEE